MIYQGQHIANIIFDLGGVILNIDYQLPVKAFERLGLEDFQQKFSQARQQALFDDYEKGKISSSAFVQQLKTQLPPEVTEEQIIDAWNSILLDLPEERLFILEKATLNHRTFLLSNTNDLHIRSFNNYLKSTFGLDSLAGYFEKYYYSYQVGMRKPDIVIFEHVLNDAGLDAATTLFIDDSIQHVMAARSCGMLSHHLQKEDLPVFLADKL